jgi:hypothetical protein
VPHVFVEVMLAIASSHSLPRVSQSRGPTPLSLLNAVRVVADDRAVPVAPGMTREWSSARKQMKHEEMWLTSLDNFRNWLIHSVLSLVQIPTGWVFGTISATRS